MTVEAIENYALKQKIAKHNLKHSDIDNSTKICYEDAQYYEIEALIKFNPREGDLLVVTDIHGELMLGIFLEHHRLSALTTILVARGEIIDNIANISENLGNQGSWEEIIIKYPEYFI